MDKCGKGHTYTQKHTSIGVHEWGYRLFLNPRPSLREMVQIAISNRFWEHFLTQVTPPPRSGAHLSTQAHFYRRLIFPQNFDFSRCVAPLNGQKINSARRYFMQRIRFSFEMAIFCDSVKDSTKKKRSRRMKKKHGADFAWNARFV